VLLTRLGVPWLWGADVEKGWVFMRFNVVPITTTWLAPGSYCYGLDRLPQTGGAVFALNHLSAIDPPLVGSFSNRAIWYMTKSELLEIPVVGEALTWAGGFPIRRGESDRDGLRKARELVREGHIVGVFVEGTRQRFGYLGEVHPGALTIAMKEDVPVIPCALESFGWTRTNRRPCCVVWGEPMRFDGIACNGPGYKQAAEILRLELLRLWRQAAGAVVAGFPPKLHDGTLRYRAPRGRVLTVGLSSSRGSSDGQALRGRDILALERSRASRLRGLRPWSFSASSSFAQARRVKRGNLLGGLIHGYRAAA
jgi:1-acyl-sn-glycerol-3-phosphate acyltransferase